MVDKGATRAEIGWSNIAFQLEKMLLKEDTEQIKRLSERYLLQ